MIQRAGSTFWAVMLMVGVAVVGLGLLRWLGHIQGDGELNSTHALVRTTADWMVKLPIGGIVGFSTGRFAINGRRGVSEGESRESLVVVWTADYADLYGGRLFWCSLARATFATRKGGVVMRHTMVRR